VAGEPVKLEHADPAAGAAERCRKEKEALDGRFKKLHEDQQRIVNWLTELGVSVRDIALLIGLSRPRVHQLRRRRSAPEPV
jgi:DNA-directed RNA polymerase specialized sigma24 family protein